MKYITPDYKKEAIESNDVILTSIGNAVLTEVNSTTANVSASIMDILGLR